MEQSNVSSFFISKNEADPIIREKLQKFEESQKIESLIITDAQQFESLFMQPLGSEKGHKGYEYISSNNHKEFKRVLNDLKQHPNDPNRMVIAVRTLTQVPLAMLYLVGMQVVEFVKNIGEMTRSRKKESKDFTRLMKFVQVDEEKSAIVHQYELPVHEKRGEIQKNALHRTSGQKFFYSSATSSSSAIRILPDVPETDRIKKEGSEKFIGLVSVESMQCTYIYTMQLCMYIALMLTKPGVVFYNSVLPIMKVDRTFEFPKLATVLAQMQFTGPYFLAYQYADTKKSLLRARVVTKRQKNMDDSTKKGSKKGKPTQRFLIRFFGLGQGEIDSFFKSLNFDENNPTNVAQVRNANEPTEMIIEDDKPDVDFTDAALGDERDPNEYENEEMFGRVGQDDPNEDNQDYEIPQDQSLEPNPAEQVQEPQVSIKLEKDSSTNDASSLTTLPVPLPTVPSNAPPVEVDRQEPRNIFGAEPPVSTNQQRTNVDTLIRVIDKQQKPNEQVLPPTSNNSQPVTKPSNIVSTVDAFDPLSFANPKNKKPAAVSTGQISKGQPIRPQNSNTNNQTTNQPVAHTHTPNAPNSVPQPQNQNVQVTSVTNIPNTVINTQNNQPVQPTQTAKTNQATTNIRASPARQRTTPKAGNQAGRPNQTPKSNSQPRTQTNQPQPVQPKATTKVSPQVIINTSQTKVRSPSKGTISVEGVTNTGNSFVVNTPQVVINTPKVLLASQGTPAKYDAKTVQSALNELQSMIYSDPTIAPETERLKQMLIDVGLITN